MRTLVCPVTDDAHEALRDLVRARDVAKEDESLAKHRLLKYLLLYGKRSPNGNRAWTYPWWSWLQKLEMEHHEQQITLREYIAEVLHQGERGKSI